MKHTVSQILSVLTVGLLLPLGAVETLANVYLLPHSITSCGLTALGVCLICLLLLPRRRGNVLLLGLTALGLGFLWGLPEARAQGKGLLMALSGLLDSVYHWGYLDFPGPADRFTIPLALYTGLLSLCVCRTFLRRKSCFGSLALCLPILVLCGLLPGAMPAYPWLLSWVAGVMLLLLTSGSWGNAPAQGAKLTLWSLPGVAAVCLGLMLFNPQATYRDYAAPYRDALFARLQEPMEKARLPQALIPKPQYTQDLASLTGQDRGALPILVVTAPTSQDLYLRGQAFTRYTGLGWEAAPEEIEAFTGWGDPLGDVRIQTIALQSVLYLPYYPESGTVLTGGCLENRAGLLSYSFPQYPRGGAASEELLEQCTALPEDTAAWAKSYSFSGSTTQVIASQIASLVQNSAVYDKHTGPMPLEEPDFARWFLERSDRGYCVHFATAAVVLLRSQGIPARYVTGFRCTPEAGVPTVVTSDQAHAWAEYYDRSLGSWQILEATAPDSGARTPVPATEATVPPTGAQEPPETQPVSSPDPPVKQRHLWPLWLLVLPLLLPPVRWTVVLLRRRYRQTLPPNKRCLHWWREAQNLGNALGETPPEQLLDLAQRAKYSRHRLTSMDLKPFEDYCAQCRRALEQRPLYKRLYYKYIRFLY